MIDAETPERAAAKLATRPLLDSAMKHYFGREFKAALAFFERTSKADPEDVVPILFTERCARYLETPPPADWQGFEKLTNK